MTSLARRLLAVPIVVWGAATLVFLVLRVVPGDAVNQAAGLTASVEQREQIRAALGLDQPLIVQYLLYMGNLVQGDLGTNFFGNKVSDELLARWPTTFKLGLMA